MMLKAIELLLSSQNGTLFTKRRDEQGSKCCARGEATKKELKLADKPGFVGFIAKADSHSSRRTITCTLKQPTRWQREPRLIYLRKNASLFGLAADGGYRVSP